MRTRKLFPPGEQRATLPLAALLALLALLSPPLLLEMFSFSAAASSRVFPSNWSSPLVPVEMLAGAGGDGKNPQQMRIFFNSTQIAGR